MKKEFETGKREVCVPRSFHPKNLKKGEECRSDFHCGYSELEGGWTECHDNRCMRVAE